jgi:hypothetical protein
MFRSSGLTSWKAGYGDGFACLPVEGAEDLGHPALASYVVEDVPFSMIRGVVAPVVTQAS